MCEHYSGNSSPRFRRARSSHGEGTSGLAAGLDVELFVNGVEVGADGAEGDAEAVGNFLVEKTLGKQGEDFLFALGEFLDVGFRFLDVLEMADDLAGDLHGHGRTAGVNLLDGSGELSGRDVFEQVAAGAGAERFEDEIAVLVGG